MTMTSSATIFRSENVQRYFKDIKNPKYNPIEDKLVRELFKDREMFKDIIINAHIRLVASIAKTYDNMDKFMDFNQEGIEGLYEAFDKYDPTSPAKFSSYAALWIKAKMSMLCRTFNMVQRSNQGKITVRHQGGGVKRKYRIIDFKRNKVNVPGTVATIEYDPNRTANIALINYADGEKRYIIAPKGLEVGAVIESGENTDIKVGNALPIMSIPVGTMVHNIELRPGKGGELARSAGSSAQILGREGNYVMIRLSSGEQRKVLGTCMATVGEVGNEDSSLVKVGKAGRSRHMGIRPTVRGSVMNPNDHPHGGGEGRAPVGRKAPMTPWGKPALGLKTRKKKQSDKFIVRRRSK